VLLVAFAFPRSTDHARRGASARGERPAATGDPVATGTPGPVPGNATEPAHEEDEREAPIAGTERWHYEGFLRQAAADPEGFARVADEKAGSGATPLEERVALLRAAWKARGKEALRWFVEAVAAAPGMKATDAAALRGFVVRHLAPHAREAPEVREFLWQRVFLDRAATPSDRSAAGRAVAEAADPGEIPALVAALRATTEVEVAEGPLTGLGRNDHPEAASALAWLAESHPVRSVCERAAEIASQRSAGGVQGDKDEEDEED